ncbi:MAG: WD40 repeat domain-containing protein [Gemmataceae bacterium]
MRRDAIVLALSSMSLFLLSTLPTPGQRLKATLEWKNTEFSSLCFHPNGKTIATGGGKVDPETERYIQGQILLWDVATGKRKATIDAHESYASDVCFSPDGTKLLSCDSKTIKLWDSRTGKELRTLRAMSKGEVILRVVFHPQGKTFASVAMEYQDRPPGPRVLFWDVATGKRKAVLKKSGVFSARFSPDGKTLALGTVSEDGSLVKLWNFPQLKLRTSLKGHEGDLLAVGWSPNGKILASADMYGKITLWESLTNQPRLTIQDPKLSFSCLAICPKKKLLALCSFGPKWKQSQGKGKRWGYAKVHLRDLFTGEKKVSFDAHYFEVFSVCISPDGNTMATVGKDYKVKLWDISNIK